MILVDTSVLVAWLDAAHEHHALCTAALVDWADQDELAVSVISFAELAAGRRTREFIEERLAIFERVDLDVEDAWRAGVAFGAFPKGKDRAVLPDFLIRAQAAIRGWRHLTNDDRRLGAWPDVHFLFVRPRRAG
jgi:predicted nucleic acid-binding protein